MGTTVQGEPSCRILGFKPAGLLSPLLAEILNKTVTEGVDTPGWYWRLLVNPVSAYLKAYRGWERGIIWISDGVLLPPGPRTAVVEGPNGTAVVVSVGYDGEKAIVVYHATVTDSVELAKQYAWVAVLTNLEGPPEGFYVEGYELDDRDGPRPDLLIVGETYTGRATVVLECNGAVTTVEVPVRVHLLLDILEEPPLTLYDLSGNPLLIEYSVAVHMAVRTALGYEGATAKQAYTMAAKTLHTILKRFVYTDAEDNGLEDGG